MPGPILMERGAAGRLRETLSPQGLDGDILIVADSTTRSFAGDQPGATLHVIAEASIDEVVRVEGRITAGRPGIVAGLGGGRPIDVAKLAAFRRGLPFVSVPTAPSHDGVASGRASLVHLGARTSIGARPPVAIVADLDILEKAPARLTASGCADIISNLTAVLDWQLARDAVGEDYDEAAAVMSREAGEAVMSLRAGIAGRDMETLVNALVKSGTAMALAGTSRPSSGSEHKFAHALEALDSDGAMHGEACGMGAVMMMALHDGDWRRIRDSLAAVGAPVDAERLNIPAGLVEEALLKAREIRPERYTILEHEPLTRAEAREIAERTGVTGGN